MREPTLRPSPSSPTSARQAKPSRSRKSSKAVSTAQASAAQPASTGLSINPIAPASAAHEGDFVEKIFPLQKLRPAANQAKVWNEHAGRPDSRPDAKSPFDTVIPMEDSQAERLITAQAPQRPLSTPGFRIEVDGRIVEGVEGQTILEVCRANGIEIPTLCYEPKLPGFGA